jgi:hypothetical protein
VPSAIWSTVEFDRGACGATSDAANQISVHAVLLHTDAGTPIAETHEFIPVIGCVPALDSGGNFLHGDGSRERGRGRGDSLRWIEIQGSQLLCDGEGAPGDSRYEVEVGILAHTEKNYFGGEDA